MLRYSVFSLFGPLASLLITGIVLQPPVANNGRHLIALVVIGFLPALVPALVAALADDALDRRRGLARYALVVLAGSAATLGLCLLSKHRVPYFSGVATVAGGMSAAFCCWLHLRISTRDFSARTFLVAGTLILAAPFALTALVRTSGVCFSQFRFVPDVELIAAAVAARADDIKGVPEPWKKADIDTYVRDNPDCCRIVASEILSGRWVQIVYEHKLSRSPTLTLVKMNACGWKIDIKDETITAGEMNRYRQQP